MLCGLYAVCAVACAAGQRIQRTSAGRPSHVTHSRGLRAGDGVLAPGPKASHERERHARASDPERLRLPQYLVTGANAPQRSPSLAASQPRDGRQKLHAIKERQPKSGEPPQGSPTNYLVHRERARAEERRGSRSGARLGGPARRACRMLAGNMALRQRAARMPGDRGGASSGKRPADLQ